MADLPDGLDSRRTRVLTRLGDVESEILRRLFRIGVVASGFDAAMFASGPVIIAANHLSLIDTVLVRYVLPPEVRRRTATVGARDFFAPGEDDRGVRRLAKSISCAYIVSTYRVCLIGRGDDMGDGLPRIERLLRDGWHVILFPEGTRSRDGGMGRFRMGVAHLAGQAGVSVLPVCIGGTDRVMPVGRPWLRSGTVEARAGGLLRRGAGEGSVEFLSRLRDEIERLGRSRG